MKLRELHLLAYGPFSGETLTFNANRSLHIIHGPNEAGKSSSLRAITDGLYGIPMRTTDDFLHPYKQLRIGMTLETSGGELIQAIRRKANKQTLRQADDNTPFDEAVWQAALEGVEREGFLRMFGIDHARLREAGREIAEGKGQVGQLLFAAGTGIGHLRSLQEQLQQQLDELFKPRGRGGSRIEQIIKQYRDLKGEVKTCSATVESWKERDQRLRDLEQAKGKIDATLREKSEQANRWRRILEATPLVNRWLRDRTEWEALRSVPDLPESFEQEYREAVSEKRKWEEHSNAALVEQQQLEQDMQQQSYSAEILQEERHIKSLEKELGGYTKAQEDRPGLLAAAEAANDDIREILRGLGRDLEGDSWEELRVPGDRELTIRNLGNQQEGLLSNRDALRREGTRLQREIRELEQKLAGLPHARNCEELKQAHQAAGERGNVEVTEDQLQSEITNLTGRRERLLAQLPLWAGTAEELAQRKIPLEETIERFEEQMQAAATQLNKCEERCQESRKAVETTQQELARIDVDRPIPGEQELEAARQLRWEGWRLVLREWQGPAADARELDEYLQHFSQHNLAGAFEHAQRETDRIADTLRQDADRVARKSQLRLELENETRKLTRLEQELESQRAQWKSLCHTWEAEWSTCGIPPLAPTEMRKWRRQYETVLQVQDELRERCQERDVLSKWIARMQSKLAGELQRLGIEFDHTVTFKSLLRQASGVLEEFQTHQTNRQEWESAVESKRFALRDCEDEIRDAESHCEDWQAHWGEHMRALGLATNATPAQANYVLSQLGELFSRDRDLIDKQRRIKGIDQDATVFKDKVHTLCQRLREPTEGRSVEQIVEELSKRFNEANLARQKQRDAHSRLERLNDQIKDAEREANQQRVVLAEQCRQAGCQDPEQIAEICKQASRKRSLEEALREREADLASRTAGQSLESFVAAVQQEAARFDALPELIRELELDVKELGKERDRLIEEIRMARHELGQIDGNEAAADKAEECESLAAGLEEEVQQWAKLRIAAKVLQLTLERHREKHQGPVLEHARRIFTELTRGAYTGLQIGYNDTGDPILEGLRGEARQTVQVEAMSDGTLDQLYLALRLASLEVWLEEHPPIPFIVDDILLNFDDARAGAALQVLQQFSRKTQVLFFTHHRHLLELAEKELPPDKMEILHLRG